MAALNIENMSMSFGNQVIFKNTNVSFNIQDKVGIVGVNGAGKSTLLKLILGNIYPDEGKIEIDKNLIVGYLPQVITDEVPNKDISVLDYLLEGRPIKKLEDELNLLYEKLSMLSLTNNKSVLKEIDYVISKLNYYDQYKAENILLKMISDMKIESLLDLKLTDISGGQKSKVAFLRLLYSKPNILLLDEPTNHLDIDTKDYIINYIKSYNGLVLVISHDIEFLNKVTNKTLYVDKIKNDFTLYNGNYEKYLQIKSLNDLASKRLYEKQIKEEEKLKTIISKYIGSTEKKANIAKDRIKKLEKLQSEKVKLEKKIKYSKFNLSMEYPSYSIPISCSNLTFGYTLDNLLYENLSFDLKRGEKLLIVGENGIGKTTLLKLIMTLLTPISGCINIGEKTKIAYYAQEHEILNNEETILNNFLDFGLTDYEIRRFLGNFLFSGDDVYKKVSILSPGERSRVALAKIALSKANTIILDEPTNHLDPMTQLIISDTFKKFEGTILVVSHNLEFVENLNIDKMLLLPSGRIIDYDRNIVIHYEDINNVKN